MIACANCASRAEYSYAPVVDDYAISYCEKHLPSFARKKEFAANLTKLAEPVVPELVVEEPEVEEPKPTPRKKTSQEATQTTKETAPEEPEQEEGESDNG